MKILLVGATGTLGRQIAKKAVQDGHEVRCIVRNPRNSFVKITSQSAQPIQPRWAKSTVLTSW